VTLVTPAAQLAQYQMSVAYPSPADVARAFGACIQVLPMLSVTDEIVIPSGIAGKKMSKSPAVEGEIAIVGTAVPVAT